MTGEFRGRSHTSERYSDTKLGDTDNINVGETLAKVVTYTKITRRVSVVIAVVLN